MMAIYPSEVDKFWKYLFGISRAFSITANLLVSKEIISMFLFEIYVDICVANIKHVQQRNEFYQFYASLEF